jgi:hypothetical protein
LPVSYAVTGPATISGSTLTVTGAGTVVVTASQSGNASYAAAVPVSRTITVSAASQTISFTGLPSLATYGSAGPYNLSASASSGLPVSYAVTGPATISGSTLTVTGAGTVVVTASQSGNASYAAAAPVSQTITISAASQTISFTGLPSSATYGSAGPYNLSATASSGLPVSYAVTGPATISGSTLTVTGAGTVVVTASQSGNASYAAAAPVSQTITISAASQTISFTGLPSSATYGSAGPYSLSASASSGLPVSYAVTGPATISGSTLTISGAGTVVVTASQPGNTSYAAAAPVSQTITISAASQTISFTGLPSSATYGSAGPYSLSATASSGLPVSYAVTGPATISGSTLTVTGAGTVVVTASQSGNASYAAAAPVSRTITIMALSQIITFSSISNHMAGTVVSLTASASSGLPVVFSSTTQTTCSVSGSTVTLITTGTCTLLASQPGNGQYSAAVPVAQSFTITPAITFSISPVIGSATVSRGVQLAGYLLKLQSNNGFIGNVSLTCSSSVSQSICVDFPETVAVRGTSYAVTGILFPESTKPGTYTVTITGTSGSLTEDTTATFKVQ